MLGHIGLPIKVIMRTLKTPSREMQLTLPTLSTPKLMTSEMERTLTWKAMWIRVRELFRIGIFWLKNSLWRPRNLVSLSILHCILRNSLAFLCSGESSISDHDLDILHP